LMDVLDIRTSGVSEVLMISLDGVTAGWVWVISGQSVVTDGVEISGNIVLLSELVLVGTS